MMLSFCTSCRLPRRLSVCRTQSRPSFPLPFASLSFRLYFLVVFHASANERSPLSLVFSSAQCNGCPHVSACYCMNDLLRVCECTSACVLYEQSPWRFSTETSNYKLIQSAISLVGASKMVACIRWKAPSSGDGQVRLAPSRNAVKVRI
jgi:hypothetical protein